MRRTNKAVWLILLLAPCWGVTHAAIFKCDQGGQVVYSDKPCPKAKTIETTNGKAPTLSDQVNARVRNSSDKLSVIEIEAAKARENEQRERCMKMARDNNWTRNTAAKYSDDKWWNNRSTDSSEKLSKECSKYLIPSGGR